MKKTIQKNENLGGVKRRPNSIENLQKKISELSLEISALRKENKKIQKLNVELTVKIMSYKNRVDTLEKLIPETLKPQTIEDKLRKIHGINDK